MRGASEEFAAFLIKIPPIHMRGRLRIYWRAGLPIYLFALPQKRRRRRRGGGSGGNANLWRQNLGLRKLKQICKWICVLANCFICKICDYQIGIVDTKRIIFSTYLLISAWIVMLIFSFGMMQAVAEKSWMHMYIYNIYLYIPIRKEFETFVYFPLLYNSFTSFHLSVIIQSNELQFYN